MMLWHYTTGALLGAILKSGVVRVARACALPGERPLAWLSANQDFEPTAIKFAFDDAGNMRVLTLAELAHHGEGLGRLGISVDIARALGFQRWPMAAARARMRPDVIAAMEQSGRDQGATPADWWGGRAIPVSAFARIEYRTSVADSWTEPHAFVDGKPVKGVLL